MFFVLFFSVFFSFFFFESQVREMALQFAADRARFAIREAELKWERDFVLGKLYERETRHALQCTKQQVRASIDRP